MSVSSAVLNLIVQLEDQAKAGLSQLTSQLSTVQGGLTGVQAAAQTAGTHLGAATATGAAQAATAITGLQTRTDAFQRTLEKLSTTNPVLRIDANFVATERQLATLHTTLQELSSKPYTAEVKADIAKARADVATLNRAMADLKANQPVITPQVNAAPAVAEAKQAASQIEGAFTQARTAAGGLGEGLSKIGFTVFGLQQIAGAVGGVATAMVGGNAQMETYTAGFQVLLGSEEAARARMEELRRLAAATPFQLPEIAAASRVLETLTNGALSTGKALTMIGDVASGVNNSFEDTALWVGRMYSAMQSGRPFGEASSRLQELGVIGGDTRNQLEDLQKSGAGGAQMWAIFTDSVAKFNGMMKVQSQTFTGLSSTMEDDFNNLKNTVTQSIFTQLKGDLQGVVTLMESPAAQHFAEQLGEQIGKAVGFVRSLGSETMKVFTDIDQASPIAVGAVAALTVAFGALAYSAGAAAVSMIIATAPITVPLGIVAAAVGALKLAWDNDFLDMQEHTRDFVHNVANLADALGRASPEWARFAAGAHQAAGDVTAAAPPIAHYADVSAAASGPVAQLDLNMQGLGRTLLTIDPTRLTADQVQLNAAIQHAGTAAVGGSASLSDYGKSVKQAGDLTTEAGKKARTAQEAWLNGMEQIAAATGPKAKTMTAGLLDAVHLLEKDVPPGFEHVRDTIQGVLDDTSLSAGQKGAAIHDRVLAELERLAQDADPVVRLMAQNLLDVLASAQEPAAIIGANTGDNYLNSLINSATNALPDLAQAVGDLLNTMGGDKVQNASALLGKGVGERYRINLLAQMGDANLKAAQAADAAAAALVGRAGAATSQGEEQAILLSASHQREFAAALRASGEAAIKSAVSQATAAHIITPVLDGITTKHKGAGAAAADAGKKTALAYEQIINAVGSAAQDTTGPSASLAQGLSDILTVAREKVPKDAAWIKAELDSLIAAYGQHKLTTAQFNTEMLGILDKLAHSPSADLSLLAQAQIDHITQAAAQITAKTNQTAEQIAAAWAKAEQSAAQSLGKLAEDSQKSSFTAGDAQIAMLDLLNSATQNKLPAVVDFAASEYARMQQQGGLSAKKLHDDVLGFLQDQATKGDAIMRAWAAAQIADIQASDAAIQQHVQEQRAAVAGGWSAVIGDLTGDAPRMGTAVKDMLALAKQASDAGMGDIASTLTADASALWSGQAGAWDKGRTDVLAILEQLRHSSDLTVAANAEEMYQAYKDGWAKTADAARQAQLDMVQALGGLGAELSGTDTSAPQALLDTYALVEKLNAAGHGDWAGRLLADAKAVALGVPGALAGMQTDVLAILTQLAASSDPIMAAWAQKQIAEAQKAADGVKQATQQLADAALQASEGLASGLGSVGEAILSGKDSPLQALQALAPLAKQAADAGFSGVAETIKYWMSVAAQGGVVNAQAMTQGILTALHELEESGSAELAIFARNAEAQLAQAAAVQAATAQLAQYQAAQKAAQDAVTANSAALQQQQALLSDLEGQYNAAQAAIQQFQNAKLQGEGGANKGIQQAGYAVDAAQLALLQAQGAGLSGAALKPYQDALAAAQGQLQLLQAQFKVTFQPQKDALKDAADAALGLDKELSFRDALAGIAAAHSRMLALAGPIRAAKGAIADLTAEQAILKTALDAANATVAAQQAAIQALQSGVATLGTQIQTTTSTALTPLPGAFSGALAASAQAVAAAGDATDPTSLLGAWGTQPGGVLYKMLSKLGGLDTYGITGTAASFWPLARESLVGLMNTGLPEAITSAGPALQGQWNDFWNALLQIENSYIQQMNQAAANIHWPVPPGTPPPGTPPPGSPPPGSPPPNAPPLGKNAILGGGGGGSATTGNTYIFQFNLNGQLAGSATATGSDDYALLVAIQRALRRHGKSVPGLTS